MGYWLIHPLGGDHPMKLHRVITDSLFTEEEYDNCVDTNDQEYAKRLLANIEDVVKLVAKFDFESEQFILPFLIAKYKVQINEKDLSDRIKEMIGDGGNAFREYDEDPIPMKDNNYTDFDRPISYANQLRDLWDDLIENGRYNELQRSTGLIEAIVDFVEEGNTGLINKK
jgi:hypothetical protein